MNRARALAVRALAGFGLAVILWCAAVWVRVAAERRPARR